MQPRWKAVTSTTATPVTLNRTRPEKLCRTCVRPRLDYPHGTEVEGRSPQDHPEHAPAAAAFIKADAVSRGCYIGDYIGWLVCRHVDVPMELPIGELKDQPDPLPAANGRAQYRAMLPREAADLVIADAERRGVTLGDYITEVVCDHYGVPFEPRVMKKALKAWAKAAGPESSCR